MDSPNSLSNVQEFLGRDILPIHYDIARALVAGGTPDSLAQAWGFQVAEITELLTDPEFMELKQLIQVNEQQQFLETDSLWDALEYTSVKNLYKTIQANKDPDLNLRVAAIANKASRSNRRVGHSVLDSGAAGSRVEIKLNRKYVDKVNGQEVSETATITRESPQADNQLDTMEMPELGELGRALDVEIKGAQTRSTNELRDESRLSDMLSIESKDVVDV